MSATTAVHSYSARDQPATRFAVELHMPSGTRVVWLTCPDRRPICCFRCRRRRWAANLIAHAYYDGTYYFCKPGKGCKAPRRRRRSRARAAGRNHP